MSFGADVHFPKGDSIIVCADSVSGGMAAKAEKVEEVVALDDSNGFGSRGGHALESRVTPILYKDINNVICQDVSCYFQAPLPPFLPLEQLFKLKYFINY